MGKNNISFGGQNSTKNYLKLCWLIIFCEINLFQNDLGNVLHIQPRYLKTSCIDIHQWCPREGLRQICSCLVVEGQQCGVLGYPALHAVHRYVGQTSTLEQWQHHKSLLDLVEPQRILQFAHILCHFLSGRQQ